MAKILLYQLSTDSCTSHTTKPVMVRYRLTKYHATGTILLCKTLKLVLHLDVQHKTINFLLHFFVGIISLAVHKLLMP